MKSKTIYDLLEITDDIKKNTLNNLNLTTADIEDAVRIITEWFQKQPHLPQIIPDPRQIECLYVGSKGSLERTKEGLDLYYTLRTTSPELFMNRDPLCAKLKYAFEGISCTIQYPVTPEGERVVCVTFFEDISRFSIYDYFKLMFMLLEIKIRYDYSNGCVFVCDLSGFTMGHLLKLTPGAFKTGITGVQGPFLARMRAVHFVNCPPYSEPFISMFKSLVKEKIRSRVFIHKNLESVHQIIDRSLLPKEYGGTLRSVRETEDEWHKEMLTCRNWFIEQDKYTSNESKRQSNLLGVGEHHNNLHGSFKKLNID